MKDYAVPIEMQVELSNRVGVFNETELLGADCRYCLDARSKFIYVCRLASDGCWQRLGRLTYEGDPENMEFAVFKYSVGRYDPKERRFAGVQHLDGTVEGALKALLEAYPP